MSFYFLADIHERQIAGSRSQSAQQSYVEMQVSQAAAIGRYRQFLHTLHWQGVGHQGEQTPSAGQPIELIVLKQVDGAVGLPVLTDDNAHPSHTEFAEMPEP